MPSQLFSVKRYTTLEAKKRVFFGWFYEINFKETAQKYFTIKNAGEWNKDTLFKLFLRERTEFLFFTF